MRRMLTGMMTVCAVLWAGVAGATFSDRVEVGSDPWGGVSVDETDDNPWDDGEKEKKPGKRDRKRSESVPVAPYGPVIHGPNGVWHPPRPVYKENAPFRRPVRVWPNGCRGERPMTPRDYYNRARRNQVREAYRESRRQNPFWQPAQKAPLRPLGAPRQRIQRGRLR